MSTIEKAAAKLVRRGPAKPTGTAVAPETGSVVDDASSSSLVQPLDNAANLTELSPSSTPLMDAHEDRVCELDFEWLSENGFLVPGHNNPKQNQEFRRIKRPLLMNTQPQLMAKHDIPTNVVFVTSALPDEGKTFVSLNLALSMAAELDRSVLLIDGDSAKGHLSRWLGIQDEDGLVDLLKDQRADGDSLAIQTNVERLSVMSCGRQTSNLDELYASDLMRSLVVGLAKRRQERIILVDGPPLLVTTEAAVLAQLMGQTVLVIEADRTPQSAVKNAVNVLKNTQLVSAVLNKAPRGIDPTYGYGYGYGETTPQASRV